MLLVGAAATVVVAVIVELVKLLPFVAAGVVVTATAPPLLALPVRSAPLPLPLLGATVEVVVKATAAPPPLLGAAPFPPLLPVVVVLAPPPFALDDAAPPPWELDAAEEDVAELANSAE